MERKGGKIKKWVEGTSRNLPANNWAKHRDIHSLPISPTMNCCSTERLMNCYCTIKHPPSLTNVAASSMQCQSFRLHHSSLRTFCLCLGFFCCLKWFSRPAERGRKLNRSNFTRFYPFAFTIFPFDWCSLFSLFTILFIIFLSFRRVNSLYATKNNGKQVMLRFFSGFSCTNEPAACCIRLNVTSLRSKSNLLITYHVIAFGHCTLRLWPTHRLCVISIDSWANVSQTRDGRCRMATINREQCKRLW